MQIKIIKKPHYLPALPIIFLLLSLFFLTPLYAGNALQYSYQHNHFKCSKHHEGNYWPTYRHYRSGWHAVYAPGLHCRQVCVKNRFIGNIVRCERRCY